MKMLQTIKSLLNLGLSLMLIGSLQGCGAVVVAGAATTGYLLGSDRRDAQTMLDDNAIEVKALNALSKNKPVWTQGHVVPVCYNNIMLLVGQMPNEDLKRQAEETVRKVAEMRQIHNEITIEAPTSVAKRSYDSLITAQIKAKISAKHYVNPKHIKVVTENGVVYLIGMVAKEEEEPTVEIARHVRGVVKVVKMFENK